MSCYEQTNRSQLAFERFTSFKAVDRKLFSIDDPGFGNFAVNKVRSDTELIMQDLLLKLP